MAYCPSLAWLPAISSFTLLYPRKILLFGSRRGLFDSRRPFRCAHGELEADAARKWCEADAAHGNFEPDTEEKTEADHIPTQKRRPGADRPDSRLYTSGSGYDRVLHDVL